jgi:hypothetical protein
MCGHRYTRTQYTLHQKVEPFANHLVQLAEHHLTPIYHVLFHFCDDQDIGYVVESNQNTGALPFEEFSEDWLFDLES